MKIVLKNIKISLAHSEETTLFNADLYVNGKKVGYAKNDGRGGCTDYRALHDVKGAREAVSAAEDFCRTLPPIDCSYGVGDNKKEFSIDMNLEHFIDDLISDKLKSDEDKKFQKVMETKIAYGVKGGFSYTTIGFKGNRKLADLMKTPQGRAAVENLKNKIKRGLKKEEVIFNENIGKI